MRYQIKKSLDFSFVETLFKKNFKIYFPEFKKQKIKKIIIEKESPSWAKETLLLRYRVFLDSQQIIIRGTAKTTHSKKHVFFLMNYLYWEGFNKGRYKIPKPLDYLHQENLLLYQEVEGLPLGQIIQEGNFKQIERYLKKTAGWLAKLHKKELKKELVSQAYFLGKRKYQKMFSEIAALMPSLKEEIKSLKKNVDLDNIQKIWKKKEFTTIIHNDFYPGNIIIQEKKIYGIDFDRAGLGPFLMDLATLCASLVFPRTIWPIYLKLKERKKFQDVFLRTYAQKRKIKPKEIKSLFGPFLIKAFLDQLHYHFYFAKKGWRYFEQSRKKDSIEKINSLIKKIYESSLSCL